MENHQTLLQMIYAVGGPTAAVSFIVWLIRLEGKQNKMDSVIEERTNKSFERQAGLQKQIDDLRTQVVEHTSEVGENLTCLIRQVGRLEGMMEMLINKSKEQGK